MYVLACLNINGEKVLKKKGVFFICQTCGSQSPKWLGRCPDCQEWGTMLEEAKPVENKNSGKRNRGAESKPISISSIEISIHPRIPTGIAEMDRVLGGGIVPGSLVLIGGDPGIGKSTLMLQAFIEVARQGRKILYVSGEESAQQIKMRSERLECDVANIFVVSETDIERILELLEQVKPDVVIVDSVQTMYSSEFSSAPGSVSQVREVCMRLMMEAKKTNVSIFLVGHVTKDGTIAGPRLLEHMVDTVLYFEGDRNHLFRILRAVKNRFGSTNEIGVFEMKESGLCEVINPSSVFLAERSRENMPGSVVTTTIEGTRPILIELQALASTSYLTNPRRTVLGLDPNRIALLVAVMEKKMGFRLFGHDIFMNVAGGVRVDDPGVDLAVIGAIASSFTDKLIPRNMVLLGEVGLTGEVRSIRHIEHRVSEIKKMGFERCVLPAPNMDRLKNIKGIRLEGISYVKDVLEQLI